MINIDIPFHDVLTIPDAMVTYATVIAGISFALVPLLFVVGILMEQTKAAKGEKTEYLALVFNTVVVIFALAFLYKWLFLKIVALTEAIGMSVFSAADWSQFLNSLESAHADSASMSIFRISIKELISNIFLLISLIIEKVFELVRYCLLAILYTVGPLAFVTYIFPPMRKILKGWFINVLQISFWIVTLKILEAAMLSLGLGDSLKAGNILNTIIISSLFTVLTVFTPLITSKLLSGETMGIVGSMAIAVVTSVVSRASIARRLAGGVKLAGSAGKEGISLLSHPGSALKTAYGKTGDMMRNVIHKYRPKR